MDRLGLRLNPNQCRCIHIDPSKAKCGNAKFYIGDEQIPVAKDEDNIKYLGKPVGYKLIDNIATLEEYIGMETCILSSTLAPWQKLDALKCFFFPSLSYTMRTCQFSKENQQAIDRVLWPQIKEVLGLPSRASNSYLYGSPDDGFLGIPLAGFDSDVAKIDSAFKLLMSKDDEVRSLAWEGLFQATRD